MAEANPFREALKSQQPDGNPFRAAASRMTAEPEPVLTRRGVMGSFLQGAMFGFADEAAAGLRALVMREDGEDFENAYYRHRDDLRAELEQYRQQAPGTALAAEIGGALVPGLGTMSMAGRFISGGASTAGRLGRAAAVGAGEGAVYGAGTAQEVSDIPASAATGAAIGGAVGAAVPAAIEGGRAVAGAIRGATRPSFAADFRIAQAMARDGVAPEEISRRLTEARRLGRPATLADVGGKNMRTELETAATRMGPGAELAEDFLTKRNREQLQRLSKDLVRGTGAKAEDVLTAIERTQATRSVAARPVYERAFQFQAELNDEIVGAYGEAIKTPLGKQALTKARRILNVENFDEAPLMERVDALKRGIDDIIESSKRSGENQIARRATQMKRELVDTVDAVNPSYRQAREIWEDGASYLDAIDSGRNIMRPNYTSAAMQREWADMTDAQREAFRIGAVDAIITRMRQQSAKEPNLLRLIRAPEIRDKLSVIMSPAKWRQFERILDLEEQMFETGTQALRNSPTARRMLAAQEQERQMRMIAAVGFIVEMATKGMRGTVMAIPWMTAATRDAILSRQSAAIADRLLSQSVPSVRASAAAAAPSFASPLAAPATAAGVAATVGGSE